VYQTTVLLQTEQIMADWSDALLFYAEQNADIKIRKPEEFVDHSLVDELEKEGFFKKLGG